jgi:hypothetical protein
MFETFSLWWLTAVILPFLAPIFMDGVCNWYIWIMNKKKGEPTWRVGTVFDSIVLPNAAMFREVTIYNVGFKRVVFADSNGGFLVIKKRTLMNCVCTYADDPTLLIHRINNQY